MKVKVKSPEEIRLGFPFTRSTVGEGLMIRGLASTGQRNRNGYAIRPSAWENAFSRQKPIVLFNHDIDRPIGKVEALNVKEVGLEVTAMISDGAISQMIEDEILSEFSVRFLPKEVELAKEGGEEFPVVTKLEGLEISVVSVPGDAGAQFEAVRQLSLALASSVTGSATIRKTEDEMLELLRKCLNLSADATEADALMEVERLRREAAAAARLKDVTNILNLSATAGEADVRTAIAELRSPKNFVSKEDHQKVVDEVANLRAEKLMIEHSSKFPPSAKDFALTMAKEGEEKFLAWLETTTSTPPTESLSSKVEGDPNGDKTANGVTKLESQIIRKLGAFKDKVEDGRKVSAEEQYAELVDLTPSEALSLVFPDITFPHNKYDDMALRDRAEEAVLFEGR